VTEILEKGMQHPLLRIVLQGLSLEEERRAEPYMGGFGCSRREHIFHRPTAEALIEALRNGILLEQLCIVGNGPLWDTDISEMLADAIAANIQLRKVMFEGSGMLRAGFFRILPLSLQTNLSLVTLEITVTNGLSSLPLSYIFEAMANGSYLRNLSILSEISRLEGASEKMFIKLLSVNQHLRFLKIWLKMSESIGRKVAFALRTNSTLEHLELINSYGLEECGSIYEYVEYFRTDSDSDSFSDDSIPAPDGDCDEPNAYGRQDAAAMLCTLENWNSRLQCLGTPFKYQQAEYANVFLFCKEHRPTLQACLQRNFHVPRMMALAAVHSSCAMVRLALAKKALSQRIIKFLLPTCGAASSLHRAATRSVGHDGGVQVVDDGIVHEDPPAILCPEEAANVNALQWVTAIAHSVHRTGAETAACAGEAEDGPPVASESDLEFPAMSDEKEQLILVKLSRNPKLLRQALCEGAPLQPARQALESEGHCFKDVRGACIFVHPWQYRSAIQALGNVELQPDHIIFSESFEYLVEETLAPFMEPFMERGRTPCKSRFQLRMADNVSIAASSGESPLLPSRGNDTDGEDESEFLDWEDCEVVVQRTFIAMVPRCAVLDRATASCQW
jgi:hypothetical protein